MLNKYDSIGIDLVAMSVNDLIVQGAKPLIFLDYISINKIDQKKLKSIIKGILEGCRISGCDLVGGETAEMPGTYEKGKFDMAGFAVGLVDEKKILRNIKKCSKNQNYKIIRGFFNDTLKKNPEEYNIKKARVIMVDCDLKESTTLALNFTKNILQIGTIILFDDYIFYNGDEKKGEYAAFEEFKKNNPNIKFRQAFEYGYGSKAFIVSDI